MSTLVKAQLLKHLSKFVKNLSADHLSLKLLQGAGDIENIELNEILLSSTLGLPPWLRLTRAHCNRMSLRLHWTRLTSEPIQIFLDVVYIDIEASEPGTATTQQEKQQQASNSAVLNSLRMPYGFINKAVDGIWLVINTVKVQFRAGFFFASLELSHVTLQSCLPDWSRDIKHLKNTRIKNTVLKQVLLFKLVKCNTLRLETSEVPPESDNTARTAPRLTPFRVIINKLVVKIQLKRSLTDSSVLCTSLYVEVDDILSVLTDAQAQVGLRFITHLQHLSAGSSVELAAKKVALARTLAIGITNVEQTPTQPVGGKSADPAISVTNTPWYRETHKYFISHDFGEHSTHIKLNRIDLHLVAERASTSCNKETLKMLDPILLEGAIRLSLENLCFNVYPAHLLGAEQKGWPRYMSLYRNARANLDAFEGCFEAIGYGYIDTVRLYAANLPHEHNPNQLCIEIRGAGKWPAIYFDSSQVVSEKDLSILDSRNAVRISRIEATFHLPTLLYLAVMAADARALMKVAEDMDIATSANRCTKIEIYELDLRYKPQVPKQTSPVAVKNNVEDEPGGPPLPSSRPDILLSVARIIGQLVERPESAMTEPTFSQSADVSEIELYSFLHSFLLSEEAQLSLSAEDFEAKCSACCSEIEASHRHLWHWQLNSIFARTVTISDGDIPLLYLPKISGFMPQTMSSGDLYVMLKSDPVEGPIQVFAERAQFDELQEMLSVFQNFASNVQKSVQIFKNMTISESKSVDVKSNPQQNAHIVFLAPLISLRLLLPAVPPLIVPLALNVATQTGDDPTPAYSILQENSQTEGEPLSEPLTVQQKRLSLDNNGAIEDEQHPLLPPEQATGMPFSPDDANFSTSTPDLFANGKMGFDDSSPGKSFLPETASLLEEASMSATNTISSSSSSEGIRDFVVVKPEDQQVEEAFSTEQEELFPNPLGPTTMNFGLQGFAGGSQEVVSVQLLVEGTTVCVETLGDEAVMPKIEVRFDRIGPINKPRVIPRSNVYFPLDLPLSFDDRAVRVRRRQFRATISQLQSEGAAGDVITNNDATPPKQCIDIWLPSADCLPLVSMSAINALAHFMSPDAPVTDTPSEPPVINIHTSSNACFSLKMDTPNVFDHLPQDLIHFVPTILDDDKVMSISISSCPLLIKRDGFNLSIEPASSSQELQNLQAEIARLVQENEQLKLRVRKMEEHNFQGE